VTAIAAQPFLLRAHAGGRVRRHVPDFFLVRADESALLVNVKPAARLADPEVAGALEWPGRIAREHGWDYEVWSGADPVFLANVRFLAGTGGRGCCPPGWRTRCWPRSGRATRSPPWPAELAWAALRAPSGPRCCGCCGSSGLSLTFTAPLTVTACWRPLMDDGMRTRLSAAGRCGRRWQ
jgi:hypothetical protein